MKTNTSNKSDSDKPEINLLDTFFEQMHNRNTVYLEDYSKSPYGISKLRFWEVESCLVCPVAGLCITASEQKRLLKKAGAWSKEISDFESHEMLVQSAKDENLLSRCVDYMLSIKYGKQAEPLYRLDERRFMAFVQDNFHPATYDLIIFASATKQDLSAGSRQQVFGRIHLALFNTVGTVSQHEKTVETLQSRLLEKDKKNKQTAQQLRELRKAHAGLTRTIEKNQSELQSAHQGISDLNEEISLLKNSEALLELEKQNRYLRDEVNLKMAAINLSHKEVGSLKAENAKLTSNLKKQIDLHKQFVSQTEEIIRSIPENCGGEETCPNFNLCRKRVFVVGGISGMAPLYRAMIEKLGGIFEYHDGRVKGGVKAIEQRLKRADCVLCPVNCNSHAACSLVKNFGKKYNKPVHMLPSFSLSAVQKAVISEQ